MSFSITPALGGNSSQSNGPNGYGQSRSHHRKAAPERIPVVQDSRVTPYTLDSPFDSQQKTSINGLRGSHRQNKSMVEHNGYPAANRSSTSTSNHSAEGGYMGPQMDSKGGSKF
ncbi:MAG: hypothetical protein LQ340_001175 [Diploschistes diacapsis]|nr:MAG: hypothetical protein LQ340_001175 [Diploschistes diacapsis]